MHLINAVGRDIKSKTMVGLHRPRRGSVLVELLVMGMILALLAALLIPMFLSAHDRAIQARCASRLRQIGQGLESYATHNKGRLPSTRPSTGLRVLPDLSSDGFDSPNPFSAKIPDDNVPAAMFLLVRTGHISPKSFVCPNTKQVPDEMGVGGILARSNFSDIARHLSYGMQNPYGDDAAVAAGFRWKLDGLPPSYPLAADRGPAPGAATIRPLASLVGIAPLANANRSDNSENHGGSGQNVLYSDGSVVFRTSPLAGVDNDHIYQTRDERMLDSPRDRFDSILLPLGQ